MLHIIDFPDICYELLIAFQAALENIVKLSDYVDDFVKILRCSGRAPLLEFVHDFEGEVEMYQE